jgi:hypothetical protein
MFKHFFYVLFVCIFTSNIAFASATVLSGQVQNITFNSNPEGAIVSVDGIKMCQTPCTISFKKTPFTQMLQFEKKGYQTISMPMTTQFDAITILNIFWDFSTTDILTGAAFRYKPNHYYADMPLLEVEEEK